MKEEQLQGNSVAGGSVIGRFSCRGFQSLRGSVIGVDQNQINKGSGRRRCYWKQRNNNNNVVL